jgi:glycosyltransferase involved in cell wall biosynthesis
MEAAVADAGLADQVQFLSGEDQIADLLAVADVLALPSLYEGMPLVVLEAMAAGVPVVGTRVCGTDEVVEDRVTGRLVPPGDPAALAGALLELLDDPAGARRCGRAGRWAFQASYTHLRMAADTAALYQQLLAHPDGHGSIRLTVGRVP